MGLSSIALSRLLDWNGRRKEKLTGQMGSDLQREYILISRCGRSYWPVIRIKDVFLPDFSIPRVTVSLFQKNASLSKQRVDASARRVLQRVAVASLEKKSNLKPLTNVQTRPSVVSAKC